MKRTVEPPSETRLALIRRDAESSADAWVKPTVGTSKLQALEVYIPELLDEIERLKKLVPKKKR